MIALPRRTSFDEASIDFIPLASISFILVALFLAHAALSRRPEVEAGAPLDPDRAAAADSIIVRISSGGTIHMEGTRHDERSFRAGFDEVRFRQPDAPVVVVLEEGARASLLARVMDQIRLAGADSVRITLREEGTADG